MKWSELPQEYQLLDIPKKQDKLYKFDSDNIAAKFNWGATNEGYDFWEQCYEAKSIEELPPLPNNSRTCDNVPPIPNNSMPCDKELVDEKKYVEYLLKEIKKLKNYLSKEIEEKNKAVSIAKQWNDKVWEVRAKLEEANVYIESQKIDIENLEKEIDKLKAELKEDREYIVQQSQQIEQAAIYIEKHIIDIENLKGSNDRLKAELRGENECIDTSDLYEIKNEEQDVCNNCGKTLREQMKGCNIISCYRQFLKKETFVEKTRKIMEPAFYMIYVDGMSSPTVKHKTIEDALKEAKRLVINTTNEVHILAHHETYKREINIIQVK